MGELVPFLFQALSFWRAKEKSGAREKKRGEASLVLTLAPRAAFRCSPPKRLEQANEKHWSFDIKAL